VNAPIVPSSLIEPYAAEVPLKFICVTERLALAFVAAIEVKAIAEAIKVFFINLSSNIFF